MESITIKVEESFAKEIDEAMIPSYSTKTEFIREAIRDKIQEVKKDKTLEALKKNFGQSKKKTTYEEERRIRELVGKRIAKEFGINLE